MVEVENSAPSRVNKDRQCRDVLFLIFFVAFWIGMFVCAGVGLSQGDPRLLIYGTDYEGNLCGANNQDASNTPGTRDLADYKYRYWPNVAEVSSLASGEVSGGMARVRSICLADCPPAGTSTIKYVCDYPTTENGAPAEMVEDLSKWKDADYDYFAKLSVELMAQSVAMSGPCYPVLLNSSSAYWSCQYFGALMDLTNVTGDAPNTTGVDSNFVEGALNDYLGEPVEVMQRYIADLELGWPVVVVGGLVVPVILSFVWLFLMRYMAAFFAYLVLILLNLTCIAVTIMTAVKAGVIGDDAISAVTGVAGEDAIASMETASGTSLDASESNKEVLYVGFIVMIIVSVLMFLFTLVIFPRLRIAIKVLQVASKAIIATPSVVLFPLTTFVALVILIVYWLFVAVYLYSSGDVSATTDESGEMTTGYAMVLDETLQYMLVYHFFGLLWGMQFIIAFGQLVIAGAISDFYWTRGEGSKASPVLSSLHNAVWYHLGSVAFGSFIIAVFEFVRAVMKYVEAKCKEATQGNEAATQMIKFFFCCIQCCLACLECIMKFINRNAYIVIAIDGTSYCTAVMRAVKLLTTNILRVAVVNTVGDSILFIGKFTISFASALIAYLYLDTDTYSIGDRAVSSPVLIVLLVFIASYAVASTFMSVTEMAVDTVLLSYCIDCDENDGRAPNAPPELNDTLDAADAELKKKEEAAAATSA
jgi:choline transporter-like protein 2/4/5